MAKLSPDQVAERYKRGVQNGAPNYAQGVAAPNRPWGAATAASAGRWQNGITRAIQTNAFQRGVQRAGDARWQTAAVETGAANYAAAAEKAATRYGAVASRVMAAGSAAQTTVSAMPGDTMEQRIARSAAAQRAISKYWQTG